MCISSEILEILQSFCGYWYYLSSSVINCKANIFHTPTSRSFIMGTGLKKWSPANRSRRDVVDAISPIGREEVLDAKMVCSGATCENESFF